MAAKRTSFGQVFGKKSLSMLSLDFLDDHQSYDKRQGAKGFDELRKYIKQGNNFCSDVSVIMQDRAELENHYTKSLSRISNKLTKASGNCIGTLADAWALAAVEMEAEAELHRQLAKHLTEELTKPIKLLADTQLKNRKPVELSVDKAYKAYCDSRNDEIKCKKKAYDITKEREKLCEQSTSKTDSKGKQLGDKELQKLEKSVKKSEESLKKIDRDYHDCCRKAESARQEWEAAIYKANTALQQLEEERISQMQEFMNRYNSHLSVIGPRLMKSSDKLGEAVMSVDTHADLRKAIDQRGTGPIQPEQVLPDFYAEDATNHMEKERRRQLLQNYLIQYQGDLEKETRAREGVEKMVEVYQNKPQYADAETMEETKHKLSSIQATLHFLGATYYKLSCAMADLEGKSKPSDHLEKYIERTRDKQGAMVSILKLPASMVENRGSGGPGNRLVPNRQPPDGVPDSPFEDSPIGGGNSDVGPEGGAAGGGGVLMRQKSQTKPVRPQQPGPRKTKFLSSRDSADWEIDDEDFESYDQVHSEPIGHCRAIYEYTGQQADELNIKAGDVITIYDKQVDGWWQGEVNGRVGIFPGSYVEEVRGAYGY